MARALFDQLQRTLATAGGKADSRGRRIKAIRAACRRLGIADDDRRAIQVELTGLASMADMDGAQLDRVLNHFNRDGRGRGEPGHAGKVRALWWTLYWLGTVDRPDDRAIDAFIKRQTRVDALRFLGHRQAHSVIDALKAWAGREGVDWPAKPDPLGDRRAVATAIWRQLVQIAPIGNVRMVDFVAAGTGCATDPASWSARTWDDAIRFLGKRLRREQGRS